jgi:hypothetical protein
VVIPPDLEFKSMRQVTEFLRLGAVKQGTWNRSDLLETFLKPAVKLICAEMKLPLSEPTQLQSESSSSSSSSSSSASSSSSSQTALVGQVQAGPPRRVQVDNDSDAESEDD